MSTLTVPDSQPAAIAVGRRTVVPLVEAVGPALPARATFPHLPAADLRALLDSCGDDYCDDTRTHLRMASQGFAILGAGRVIIVDTCLGGPKPALAQPRPGFDSQWLAALAAAGVKPADVDTVVNTHLHHDHIGWNTVLTGGRLRPTFTAARYLITGAEYAHATAGSPRRHIADGVLPVQAAGQLDLVDLDTRIDDDVRLVPAPGHTPGHVAVEISSQGQTALLAADLIHHPLQLIRPEISTALCHDPAASSASRRRVLERYADTGALILFTHLMSAVRIGRDVAGGFAVLPPVSRGAALPSPRRGS
ncbi:MBL fold metallo-hydrolase [Catellatospora bangladeshensis]|uniref:MBL fold metallo-hydrolase n=1 Tax=Catellatospora bangladeshensis TaxID=310355 RepID=A0A8J3JD28_9ACTN|nr:MBL fold metallo-hydrolase [Catellatospora bangladeshensis]GIF82131.1 MBL fold metallo-hydrolase [Catellatospora bangladeshensis]